MEIHIGNRIADIQLISKDGNNVVLSIDGKEFEIDVVMAENGSCSILHDGKSFNAQLIRQEDGKTYQVDTHMSSFKVNIVDSQAKYLQMRKKTSETPEDKIASPMAGKVISIPVTKGQEVKAGDVLIIVEAMKMQNEITAPVAGTLKSLNAVAGQGVKPGDVIAVIGK